MINPHKKIAVLFLLTYGTLIIGTYPLAILPSGFISLSYHISIQSVTILSLFSFPIIFSSSYRPHKALFAILFLFLSVLTFNYFWIKTDGVASLNMLGNVVIPFTVAIIVNSTKLISLRNLSFFLFFFWLTQIVHGFWSVMMKEDVIGFTGNRNWMASLLLALTPWCYLFLRSILNKYNPLSQQSKKFHLVELLSILLTSVPTLYLVYKCSSRAAWLSLFALSCMLLLYGIRNHFGSALTFFNKMNPLEKVCSGFVAVLGFVTLGAYIRLLILYISSSMLIADVESTIKSDVRLPLWSATCSLIKDNDLILSHIFHHSGMSKSKDGKPFGVGPGEFTKEFVLYRSHSTYHDRLVAAPVTIHPHNEFLNIASQMGILLALGWFFMLFPLVKNIPINDPLRYSARFSAFILYFHSFFDMPMVQSPGNLVAFFCLGVCWKNQVRRVKAMTERSSRNFIKKTAVSLSIFIFLFGSVHILAKDLRIDWNIRRGILQEALMKYQSSFNYYEKAIQIDPNNVRSLLFAGTLALDKMHKPGLALPILQKAYTLDPNFAHLNAKIAQALGSKGAHREALNFFIRECKLFPKDPRAYQGYLINLLLNDEFSFCLKTSEHLDALYYEKILIKQNQVEISHLIKTWELSVKTSDVKSAIKAAEMICGPINKTFIDPLLYVIGGQFDWPKGYSKKNFNQADFIFWQQLVLLKELSKKLLATTQGKMDKKQTAQNLLHFVHHQIEIDPQITSFQFPEQIWANKKGNLLSFYTFFAQLAYQSGFNPMIQFTENNQPKACLLFAEGQIFSLDLLEKSIRIKNPDTISKTKGKICIMPQEFLLKNQILGSIIAKSEHDLAPRFNKIPSLRVIELMRSDSNLITFLNLKEYCLNEPTTLFVKNLLRHGK